MSYSAESYEKNMVPALFGPWADHLIQSANVGPGEHLLDVACGTGIVARRVAPRVGPQGMVTGLDLDPDKLSMARLAAEREGLAIEWRLSPAEKLPFPESSFDLILCQFGLMFFTDRHAALTEMHRVLRTGGRLGLSVWQGLDRHPFYQTLHDVSKQHFGLSGVEDVFSLGDSDELCRLLTDADFHDIQIDPISITARYSNPEELLTWEMGVDPSKTPALRQLDAQAQQAILAAARHDMQAPLQERIQDGHLVLPTHAHVAHARK